MPPWATTCREAIRSGKGARRGAVPRKGHNDHFFAVRLTAQAFRHFVAVHAGLAFFHSVCQRVAGHAVEFCRRPPKALTLAPFFVLVAVTFTPLHRVLFAGPPTGGAGRLGSILFARSRMGHCMRILARSVRLREERSAHRRT